MQFTNQFADVPPTDRTRTTIEMPRKVEAQIKNLEPKTGVLQITTSILITKLTDELSKSNLSAGDRHAYHDALANLELRLPAKYYPTASGDTGKRSTAIEPAAGKKRNSTGKAVSGHD